MQNSSKTRDLDQLFTLLYKSSPEKMERIVTEALDKKIRLMIETRMGNLCIKQFPTPLLDLITPGHAQLIYSFFS